MSFALIGLVLGAVLGAFMARRRGGSVADTLQWAAVMAIILAILGLFLSIVVVRSTMGG